MEQKQVKAFSNKKALVLLIIALLLSIFLLIFAILMLVKKDSMKVLPKLIVWLGSILVTLIMWAIFFSEIAKVTATDEELEEWKQEILAKKPNFKNFMTQQDMVKNGNKLSFWLHTLKHGFLKVFAGVSVPIAVLATVMGIILPLSSLITGGGFGSSFSGGTYLSDCANCVVVTAYKFEDSSKTCYQGYKDGGKYTWTNNSSYSVSGSKISTKYGTFTIQNGGKKLQDSLGGYWIKA